MPLPPSKSERRRLHQRRITVDGFKRTDGLWEIEARLVDAKDQDYPLSTGLRRAGEAVHDMSLRVTIDGQMNVLEAVACIDAAPYLGECDAILPDYAGIVGLNLFQGFLKTVKERFGHQRGCTHLTELMMFLPTAALQTFASEMLDNDEGEEKPFQLDRCHALVSHSDTVRRYYPRWYRANSPESQQE